MKKLVVLLLAMAVATSAFAVIDPDDDMMGFYFDAAGDNNCMALAAGQFTTYVLYTNPTVAFIEAYTFDYDVTTTGGADLGAGLFRLATVMPSGAIRVGEDDPLDASAGGDFAVGVAEPLFAVNGAVVLVQFNWLLSAGGADLHFNLRANPIPSLPGNLTLPEVQGPGGSAGLMTVGFSTQDGFDSAVLNGDCPVAEESSSWGSVKSLYR